MAGRDTGKRKLEFDDDDHAFKRGKKETTERYRAILQLVKDQMDATERRHEAMLDLAKAEAKEELLSAITEAETFDFVIELHAVEEERARAEAVVSSIKVPTIDWDKLGEPRMND